MSEPTPAGEDHAILLRRFLADRDVTCPRCGYNLRASTSDRCAECGLWIRLGIHPLEPLMKAWILATVAAALGAGVGLLFLMVGLKAGLPRTEFYYSCFVSWGYLPLLAFLVVGRQQFLRRPMVAQRIAAWSICLVLATIVFGLRNVR